MGLPSPRWRYFELAEFACKGVNCCGGQNHIDHAFVDMLDELRHRCGFPLKVTSGYRCPDHNNRVSTTGRNGPHTKSAVDLDVNREQAWRVLREALDMNFTGIGVKQHGDRRFIHLDSLPDGPGQMRPTVWSYAG